MNETKLTGGGQFVGCVMIFATIFIIIFIVSLCSDGSKNKNVTTNKINDKPIEGKALVKIFNDVDKTKEVLSSLPVIGKMSPWSDDQMGGSFSINQKDFNINNKQGFPLASISCQLLSDNRDYIKEMELGLFLFPQIKFSDSDQKEAITSFFIENIELAFNLLNIVLPENLSNSIKKGTDFNFEDENMNISFKVIKGIKQEASYDYTLLVTTKLIGDIQ